MSCLTSLSQSKIPIMAAISKIFYKNLIGHFSKLHLGATSILKSLVCSLIFWKPAKSDHQSIIGTVFFDLDNKDFMVSFVLFLVSSLRYLFAATPPDKTSDWAMLSIKTCL